MHWRRCCTLGWNRANDISIIHPTWIRTPLIDSLVRAGKKWNQPVLEAEQVSSAVVNQIVSGNGGQVLVPGSSGIVSMVRSFPQWLQERIRNKSSMIFVRLREWESEISK